MLNAKICVRDGEEDKGSFEFKIERENPGG
jgi:hypothetical protein